MSDSRSMQTFVEMCRGTAVLLHVLCSVLLSIFLPPLVYLSLLFNMSLTLCSLFCVILRVIFQLVWMCTLNLCQGGYAFTSVCLSVRLFVCWQDYLDTTDENFCVTLWSGWTESRAQSFRFWVTLTEGQGHLRSQGHNRFWQIAPFKIVLQSRHHKIKSSLFSSLILNMIMAVGLAVSVIVRGQRGQIRTK